MSWLSEGLKKVGHNPITEGSKTLLKKGEKFLSSKIPHTHEKDRRMALQAAKEQIDYYKQAKEEIGEQRRANEAEKQNERRKISEKQIRARKATYRRAGFLESPVNTPQDTLG